MSRVLKINDELYPQGSDSVRYQVLDPRPRGGSIKLFNFDKRQDEYHPQPDINQALIDGTLVLKRKNEPRVSPAAQHDPTLAEELRTAMEQVRIIKTIQQKFDVSFNKAYRIAISDSRHAVKDIVWKSRATLNRYMVAERNGLPLLRGPMNKGNRTPRYCQAVVDLIVDAANRLYLTVGSRWTRGDLVHYINDEAREAGLIKNGQRISQKFISKTIHSLASADPEQSRMDRKLVPAAKSIGANRIKVRIPFERVEQDAVHLPFKAMTRHGVAETIYLVHAIDCCTSMPLGWHLVIGHPSESDGLRCTKSYLFPKPHAFERLGLDPKHDRYGTPMLLVFDNGPEAKGERMSRLSRLGIDAMYCKSRHAHGKPFIERLNRSLKEAIQVLSGCTRMDGTDGQRDPIALGDQLMTVDQLESWIVRWYYESWVNKPLIRHLRTDFLERTDLGGTPAERWRTITEELKTPLPLSPSKKAWQEVLYTHEERTISRKTGVTIEGLNYRGPNLAWLVERVGETRVKVLINPDDYRQVFVSLADDQQLIALTEEFVDEATPAYTFSQMKEQRSKEREAMRESEKTVAFRRDVHRVGMSKPKKSRSKKQTRSEERQSVVDAEKEAAALHRAIKSPLVRGPADDSESQAEISQFAINENVSARSLQDRKNRKECE